MQPPPIVPGVRSPVADAGMALAEQVVRWYRLYCGFLLFLWAVVTPLLLLVMFNSAGGSMSGVPSSMLPPDFAEMQRQRERERILIFMVLTVIVLVPLIMVTIAALMVKPSPGAWVFHLVMICLGMSGCTLPASVALLVYWLKPEVQAYFGRRTGP